MNDYELLSTGLAPVLASLLSDSPPIPAERHDLPPINEFGQGADALPELWRMVAAGSAKLGSGLMMGHMDTGPHPIAVMSDALVSALNNNLLFRELSPVASRIEEAMIDHFIARFDLAGSWAGTFVSGGSIANLTALFAACGGFADLGDRQDTRIFIPAHAHASIKKSAAVLGIAPSQVAVLPGDAVGKPDPAALDALLASDTSRRRIVVAIAGSTIHGAMDPLADIATVAKRHGAWLHVDAIYGGALAYSRTHNALLRGIAEADSIVLGPQKWLYVPRLSAVLLVRDRQRFDQRLGVDLPYSVTGESHRGKWGLQGSRRADAVVLWLLLQALGTDRIGQLIDDGIQRARSLHRYLAGDPVLAPTHEPDLNVQCFHCRTPQDGAAMAAAHRRLTEGQGAWVSLARWRDELVFRSVLLSPRTTEEHLLRLIADVRGALAGGPVKDRSGCQI
jgi:L-2,4-diaminobutyrate decarboxylase